MVTVNAAIHYVASSESASIPVNTPASHTVHTSALAEPISLTLGKYQARLANKDADCDAACRLRFHVFNAELGEGLIESHTTGSDHDKYDQICDHLIVEDTHSGLIVGTYRMQPGFVAAENFGYYSQQEFDLSPYEPLRPQILELGRACIHKDHRSSEVLTLLWRAIALYSRLYGLRYLIGCSSLTSRDPRQGWALYHQLQNYLAAPEFRTTVIPRYQLPPLDDPTPTSVNIPKLLRTYIGTGARICSQPAWDREFGTIDFLTLLDLEQLSPAARNRFLTHTGKPNHQMHS